MPFLVQWPGRRKAGSVYRKPALSRDLMPSFLAAAGHALPASHPTDGVDILPYLSGTNPGTPHEDLFWRAGRNAAVRSGDWKLLRLGPNRTRLYNLAQALGEKTDLAAKNPAKLKDFTDRLSGWDSGLSKPKEVPRSSPTVPVKRRADRVGSLG